MWRVVAVIGSDAVILAPVAREESNAQVAHHLNAGNARTNLSPLSRRPNRRWPQSALQMVVTHVHLSRCCCLTFFDL